MERIEKIRQHLCTENMESGEELNENRELTKNRIEINESASHEEKEKENYADEYGEMDSSGLTAMIPRFELENGNVLENAPVRYNTWGKLNEKKNNVIVVCHALTGNSRLDTWWGSMLGPNLPFDTSQYLIVCCNILGSCYGTAGPLEINPKTGKKYGADFPKVTVRDTVRIHWEALKKSLEIDQVFCVIGGSLGGMQALEWAYLGDFVKSSIVIACGGKHHAWQIAISQVQRQAIYSDPLWKNGHFDPNSPPLSGLALARQIAMISYRTHEAFELKFGRNPGKKSQFSVQEYLDYQGQKFLKRFDPHSYIIVTEMMDSHDVSRGRGNDYHKTLQSFKKPVLVIGVDSDVLYPLSEQKVLAQHIPNSKLVVVTSFEGHDGFLLEQQQIGSAIKHFLASISPK